MSTGASYLQRRGVQKGQDMNSQAFLLSSCPSWIIVIVSGLWLAQTSPLKAMDPPEVKSAPHINPALSSSRQFYQDADHPQTQEFWKEKDLSQRLKNLKAKIEQKKQEIINYTTNSISFSDHEVETYKKILKCPQCEVDPVLDLNNIHLNDLFSSENPQKPGSGWSSGTEVIILQENNKNLIAIKKFKDIKKGLEELFCSLMALDMNPAPRRLKMARIYDASICPQNSLSIIMEAVNTTNIHHFLSTPFATNAIKASAEYLANFHIENHHRLNKDTDRKKYINHVASFFNTLKEDAREVQDVIFKLLSLRPREELSDDQLVRSDNVVSLLPQTDQEKFESLVNTNRHLFTKNAENIYRGLQDDELLKDYFLTLTHGDAHAHNFFYDASQLKQNGADIPEDSFQRVSMIDFASIIKTYGSIGDPAEDVGRFLAALWNWWAIEHNNDHNDEKVYELQKAFMACYLETIKKSGIIAKAGYETFEKMLRENSSFYKLRYYRAIFNVKKNDDLEKDREIKKKFLESWIKENSALASFQQKKPKKIIQKEKEEGRCWHPVCTNQSEIIHWLPDESDEFIEASAEGGEDSYLTCLWKRLENTGNVTLSSTAAIAGMGGIGKTTLAIEYAYEAFKNKAYNLVRFIHSETYASLIRAYKEILSKIIDPELRNSVKYESDERIISLMKQYIPKQGKCLLIYDNVPDADFLKDRIPGNSHILITSRCTQGWENPPLVLDAFRAEDSLKYLLNVTKLERTLNNIETAEDLSEALGHFPLALAHAAHYIKLVGGEKVSAAHFKDYLNAFKNEQPTHFEENRHPLTEAQSKITHKNLIAKTLRISEKYISRAAANSTLAEEIMGFCAYLSPDTIIEDIFIEYCRNKEEITKAELNKVLNLLSSLSFLKRSKNEATVSIHRLVQLVIRNKKESKDNPQYEKVFSNIVPVFNKLFEKNIYTEEQINTSLNNLSHIVQLLENSARLKISFSSLEYLEWVGWFIESIESLNLSSQYQIGIENIKDNPLFYIRQILDSGLRSGLSFQENPQSQNDFSNLADISDMLTGKKAYNADQLSKLLHNGNQTISLEDIAKNREYMEKVSEKIFEISGVPKNQIKNLAQSFIKKRLLFERLKTHNDVPQQLIQIAEKGHSILHAALGTLYWSGPQDMKKAFYWFTKAAKGGNREAQFALGWMNIDPNGPYKNKFEAIRWYTAAASQGHPKALYNLGLIYTKGEGVKQDYDLGIKYLTEAANQEYTAAQLMLGTLYCDKRDIDKAVPWLEKAAKNGDTRAPSLLGPIYEIKKDYSKALEWNTKAAELGDVRAQFKVGLIYYIGEEVTKDIPKAIHWLSLAAEQGDARAQFKLGLIYTDQKDQVASFNWFGKAAQLGHVEAQVRIGMMYDDGIGVQKNDTKAFIYYSKAAEKGDREAQYLLGKMYALGQGMPQNEEMAFGWFFKAAQQGHPDALNLLEM